MSIENSSQLKQGTLGEDLFEQWLVSRGLQKNKDFVRYTWEDNKEEQRNHIDFLVKGHGVDVKWGTTVSHYGNITAEYKQIKHYLTGKREELPGNWLRDCKSEYMLYGDSVFRKFYVVDVNRLRQVIANPKFFRQNVTKHMTNDGGIYSFFYAMPYSVLEGARVIIGEICLGDK